MGLIETVLGINPCLLTLSLSLLRLKGPLLRLACLPASSFTGSRGGGGESFGGESFGGGIIREGSHFVAGEIMLDCMAGYGDSGGVMNYLQKQTANKLVRSFLSHAKELREIAEIHRELIAEQSGCAEGLNRFPVSGGICDHWDDWQKESVLSPLRKAQDIEEKALKVHCASGRHAKTFRGLVAEYRD